VIARFRGAIDLSIASVIPPMRTVRPSAKPLAPSTGIGFTRATRSSCAVFGGGGGGGPHETAKITHATATRTLRMRETILPAK
jgi:hypothetical protein